MLFLTILGCLNQLWPVENRGEQGSGSCSHGEIDRFQFGGKGLSIYRWCKSGFQIAWNVYSQARRRHIAAHIHYISGKQNSFLQWANSLHIYLIQMTMCRWRYFHLQPMDWLGIFLTLASILLRGKTKFGLGYHAPRAQSAKGAGITQHKLDPLWSTPRFAVAVMRFLLFSQSLPWQLSANYSKNRSDTVSWARHIADSLVIVCVDGHIYAQSTDIIGLGFQVNFPCGIHLPGHLNQSVIMNEARRNVPSWNEILWLQFLFPPTKHSRNTHYSRTEPVFFS